MTHTHFILPPAVLLVLLALLGGMPVAARDAGVTEGVTKKELLVEPLAGDATKQVVTDFYRFPPDTVLPWHIHPGAHEIAYVISGEMILEIEGEDPRQLKAGESFYLHPDKIHRGLNQGSDPVELFVVRIKPADKPLAEDVEPPKTER